MKGETSAFRSAAVAGGLSAVGALVRRHDRDRYATALFAPATRREALFALYAFNYEVARVREAVSQPMLGQIRLQWWREVIDAAYAGTAPRAHEVAAPLTAAIRAYGLSRDLFDRLIDSRERDLDDEPPATLTALEDYAEGTSAALIRLALEVLGVRGGPGHEAARPVGVGYALSGLLRAMPFHARAGRSYIPPDVAARAGLDPRDYAGLRSTPALRAAVRQIADLAAAHLAAARVRRVPRAALPALLPATIADRALRQAARVAYDPFAPALAAPNPLLAWRLAAAMVRRRF